MGRGAPAGGREPRARRALRRGGAGGGRGGRPRAARHAAPAIPVGRRPPGRHRHRVRRRRRARRRPRGRAAPGPVRGAESGHRAARRPARRPPAGGAGPYRPDRRAGRPVTRPAQRRSHVLPFVRGGTTSRRRLRAGEPADGTAERVAPRHAAQREHGRRAGSPGAVTARGAGRGPGNQYATDGGLGDERAAHGRTRPLPP